jgi:hypothetical protein
MDKVTDSAAAKILNAVENNSEPFFAFTEADRAGMLCQVETGRLEVDVDREQLLYVNVGRLCMVASTHPDKMLLGRWEKVLAEGEANNRHFIAAIGLVGSVVINREKRTFKFSKSMIATPVIGSDCYLLEGEKLTLFMSSISVNSGEASLTLGKFSLDEKVDAYMNGDALFQRHMALVGSSGCGKSWTVAAIVEQVACRQSANILLFDIHGEYQALKYAMQVRLATPNDLEDPSKNVLFMPTWFMSHEELMTMFLDKADPNAAIHSLMINECIRKHKMRYLKENHLDELLKSFTVDSPVPYDFQDVLKDIIYMNTELIPGIGQGEVVKGPFFGKFDQLIPRLEAKVADKRYGFMFRGDRKVVLHHDYINYFTSIIMGTGIETKSGKHERKIKIFEGEKNKGVKVLNMSLAPSELLPVLIGIMGRFVFNVQFWNNYENRHPMVLFCDECHLYLPPLENCNDAQRNTVFQFGRIAKEGRKYGMTLAAITQRPSDLNPTILSQCGNLLTLRLTNIYDQQIVKKMMSDGMSGLVEELPLLAIGELIPIGDAVVLPLKIKVTPAKCPPQSETPTYCSTWSNEHADGDNLDVGIDNMRKQTRNSIGAEEGDVN